MSVQSVTQQYKSLINLVGKATAAALFPNDIELYIIAFELVNSSHETEDYFLFPVQPFSISEQNKPIQNIKKTAGGVTVLSSQTFALTDTQIQGNFGRQFRFLLGQNVVNFSAYQSPTPGHKPENANQFNSTIKTGYGCCKVLEGIFKKSNQLDSKGQPYALYFYNLAFGNSYLVKVSHFDFYQSQEMNMIWGYNAGIKSLLPVSQLNNIDQRSLTASLAADSVIQSGVNMLTSKIGQILQTVI